MAVSERNPLSAGPSTKPSEEQSSPMLSQKSLRSGRQTSTTAASDTAWLAAVRPPIDPSRHQERNRAPGEGRGDHHVARRDADGADQEDGLAAQPIRELAQDRRAEEGHDRVEARGDAVDQMPLGRRQALRDAGVRAVGQRRREQRRQHGKADGVDQDEQQQRRCLPRGWRPASAPADTAAFRSVLLATATLPVAQLLGFDRFHRRIVDAFLVLQIAETLSPSVV